MSQFSTPIAEQIWDMKYRLKAQDGTAIDASVEDTWRRVARASGTGSARSPIVWGCSEARRSPWPNS